MGVECGSQAVLCEYPVRLDTYTGCSHGCRYCFAQTKVTLHEIMQKNSAESLRRFIEGKRTQTTNWCDWAIPLHWGGLSDPFQPIERKGRASLECLKVFAETKYPVIISTKGKLITEEPYLSLLKECNAVMQVSMVFSSYDRMEKGAPTFEERMKMLEIISGSCKRLIVRAQPYITSVKREFIGNIPRFADAGVYGVTVEGMKFKQGRPGLVKVRGDFCYPEDLLESHYAVIRDECHANGLAFFCAENRLRPMGDSTACCGCGGLPGFEGNHFNAVSLLNGDEVEPTERMRQNGTAMCFKAIHQDTQSSARLKATSFASQMMVETESYAGQALCHTKEESLAFTRWLKGTGVTAAEINALTGTQMASHYLCTNPDGQYAVPTPAAFTALRRSRRLRNIPPYIMAIVYGGGSVDTARGIAARAPIKAGVEPPRAARSVTRPAEVADCEPHAAARRTVQEAR